jgi:hypothetical protein
VPHYLFRFYIGCSINKKKIDTVSPSLFIFIEPVDQSSTDQHKQVLFTFTLNMNIAIDDGGG